MKILSLALLLMASLAFVLMGCSDSSGPIVPPSEQAITPSNPLTSLGKGGAVVNSATGNGAITYGGKIVVNTFSAHRYANGFCDGEYGFNAHALDPTVQKWHGKVLSLKVWYGNTAVIGGTETGQIGHVPDTYDVFVVVDNGEGANAEKPDMRAMSIYWAFTRADAERVWNMPPEDVVQEIANQWFGGDVSQVMVPVEMGNISVR